MTIRHARLIIRVGQSSLAFAYTKSDGKTIEFMPYKAKIGISMAANLREALKDETMALGDWKNVLVLIDSPVVMVPIDEYNEQEKETLYNYTITGQENAAVLATILPGVNAVALYALNKDLRVVLTDNFQDIKIHPVCGSMWQYLQRRSNLGMAEKIYCYFHDSKIDVCSFRKNRFRFVNSFAATYVGDIAYFVMSAWTQLGLNAKKDEIYLLGDFAEYDKLTEQLHRFVNNVFRIKPSADFNRNPLTQISGVPFDLITTLLK